MPLKRQILGPDGTRSRNLQNLTLNADRSRLRRNGSADQLAPEVQQLLKLLAIAPALLLGDRVEQVG